MEATKLKIKAAFFIMLLGGYEALRVHEAAKDASSFSEEEKLNDDPSAAQGLTDSKCTWSLLKASCSEDCSFRPLPLDKSMSDSCRLSDEYMLANDELRSQFVKEKSEMLESKSLKFKDKCIEAGLRQPGDMLRCYRRVGRMLQAAKFLTKTTMLPQEIGENISSGFSEEEYHVGKALRNAADVFGPDASYVIQLQLKMSSDSVGMAKDPVGSFRAMIDVMMKLASGSEAERQEARDYIEQLPMKNATDITPEERKEVEAATGELMRKYSLTGDSRGEQEWNAMMKSLPEATKEQQGASALLEVDSESGRLAGSNKMLVTLVVVILLLFFLGFLPGLIAIFGAFVHILAVVLVVVLLVEIARRLITGVGKAAKAPTPRSQARPHRHRRHGKGGKGSRH